MKKRIYISGKITGIEYEAIELFNRAESDLLQKGFDVVNPMKLEHAHDKSWHSYMKEDIKALCDCSHIYLLSNWMESKGAVIEHALAKYLDINIIFEL